MKGALIHLFLVPGLPYSLFKLLFVTSSLDV
jgi:hypothetical protein